MPFDRPSLSDLRAGAAADINGGLGGVDARLRYSNLGVLGDVCAGTAHLLYGFLDWIARQSVPFTATDEYLEGWAALRGVTRKPATAASGLVSFAATNGATIPAGAPVLRSDGVTYKTTAAAVASGGAAVVAVTADSTGAAGNTVDGATLLLGIGVSGVAPQGAASGPISGGADIEDDLALRSRMLAVYASAPQGGAITDYLAWALAVPGVTRAWIQPGAQGPGSVGVLFMMDGSRAAQGGFPQGTNGVSTYEARDTTATGDQRIVADALFARQAVTALVYAIAPLPNNLDFTIAGLAAASNALKAQIAGAIDAALLTNAVPGGTTPVSAIESAIAAIPGTQGYVITAIAASAGTVGNGGIGNISSDAGTLPVRRNVTYV